MKKALGIALSIALLSGMLVPGVLADGEPEPVALETESAQVDDTYIDGITESDGGEVAPLPVSEETEAENTESASVPETLADEAAPEASGDEYTAETAESANAEDTAETADDEETFDPDSVEVGPEDDLDDPLYARMQSEQSDQTSTIALFSTSTYDRFTTRALDSETLHKGIDVSDYQKDIDWEKVAADGVEFAIIRVAYRGYGDEGTLRTDECYKANIEGALAAGLKVGVYIFSQAITVEEAEEEAQLLVAKVKDYDIDLPLVIDYEYPGSYGRLYNAGLSQREGTDICLAFCQAVEDAGYESMVYANYSMLRDHLYADEFDRVWLAHYTTETSYPGSYEYWQCSSAGSISGISGNVDLDFWFEPGAADTPDPVTDSSSPFTDVSTGNWFYDTVMQAYNAGIVTGMGDGTFSPNTTATRGHVVTMLYRMTGSPAVSGTTSFTDLTASWYKDAVTWASQNQIVSGYSETQFAPGNNITREELAVMLYRLSGSPSVSGDLSAYTDAGNIHSWAEDAMVWAVEKGIITGYEDKTLRPNTSATRAEVCTMLMRYQAL